MSVFFFLLRFHIPSSQQKSSFQCKQIEISFKFRLVISCVCFRCGRFFLGFSLVRFLAFWFPIVCGGKTSNGSIVMSWRDRWWNFTFIPESRWLSTIYQTTICSSRVRTCLRHPSFPSDIHGEHQTQKTFFLLSLFWLNEFCQIWSIRLQLKQIPNASPEESGIKIIKCITRWDMENNFSICKCHK